MPQASTQQDIHTKAQHMGAAPQIEGEGPRHAEQQAEQVHKRRRDRREAYVAGDASRDDLGTVAMEKVRDSRSERATIGHTAAGHNKRKRNMDEAEHWKGRDRTRRIHEEEMGWHMADGHTMVKADGSVHSEPHVAAHTTVMAHPAKRGEKHKHTNEDDGQRKKTRRDDDVENKIV